MSDARRLVDKILSYAHVLRDDVGVIEYAEQLTYLPFLKIAHERPTGKLNPEQLVPPKYFWPRLLDAEGAALEIEYTPILQALGRQPGTLSTIFRDAQNHTQDQAKRKRLLHDLIDKEQWSAAGSDVNGDAYETLLAKGASDKGSRAEPYFTPRSVISAVVDCVQPTVEDTVVGPACGTGDFLLPAHEYASRDAQQMTPPQRDRLRTRSSTAPSSWTAPRGSRRWTCCCTASASQQRVADRDQRLARCRPGQAMVRRAGRSSVQN